MRTRRTACSSAAVRPRGASRGAGRRALFDRQPAGLSATQPRRVPHVLEACRAHPVEHLVYASSSSVYGGNAQDAVLGGRQRRPSGEPLRGDQEGQRADGAHATATCTASRPRACASSPSTGRGAGRTWRTSRSRATSSPASRSPSSTTARCCATSPTSTTSSTASSPCSTSRPRPTFEPRPRPLARAVPRVQHRQPGPGRARRLHRRDRARAGRRGRQGISSRCSRATCRPRTRDVRPGRACRLCAEHAARAWGSDASLLGIGATIDTRRGRGVVIKSGPLGRNPTKWNDT